MFFSRLTPYVYNRNFPFRPMIVYIFLAMKYVKYMMLMSDCLVQPVKIIDPHLVSSFFDGYKRAYLHTTLELENRSGWVAECSLKIQVTTEVENSICLVEHLHTQHLSIPPGARVQYSFPEVCTYLSNLKSFPLVMMLVNILT